MGIMLGKTKHKTIIACAVGSLAALILLTAAIANAQTTAQPVATEPVIHEHAHEHTMAANHDPPFQSPACELPLSDHTRGHDALTGDTDGHAHFHTHILPSRWANACKHFSPQSIRFVSDARNRRAV